MKLMAKIKGRNVYIVENPDEYKRIGGICVTAKTFWTKLIAEDDLKLIV